MPDQQARMGRLRWLCRRGMKELDVLLERFIAENQQALSLGEWPELETLLSAEDDLLWDWLQNPGVETARPYAELLNRIRRG